MALENVSIHTHISNRTVHIRSLGSSKQGYIVEEEENKYFELFFIHGTVQGNGKKHVLLERRSRGRININTHLLHFNNFQHFQFLEGICECRRLHPSSNSVDVEDFLEATEAKVLMKLNAI